MTGHNDISAGSESAPQHDHRVYFACECCSEHEPEHGVSCRSDIGVMPDGTWLCDNCYSDCDKTAYGMVPCDVDDFEFPRFEDLPRPAPYQSVSVAQAPLEPVAWQVFDKNAGWLHIPDSLADSYRKEGEKVRPLYAHPPFSAKQNLQELLEESRAALARIDAAPPPAAPVETKTVYVKRWRTLVNLPAKYADEIVEALRAPVSPSSAGRDREGEIDFSVPLTNKIMGAARLHTHDHEIAYNITREIIRVLDQPQTVPVPAEPTEGMLNAARDWSVKKYGLGIGNDAAIGCWKEMLAAAMTRPTPQAAPVTDTDLGDLSRHEVNCDWFESYDDSRCRCSLRLRQQIATERAMHRAWRKRAEEAETALLGRVQS